MKCKALFGLHTEADRRTGGRQSEKMYDLNRGPQWQTKAERKENTMSETIRITYFSDEIEKLDYIDGKSDWIDLRAAEHVVMKAGEFRLIDLGVSMCLPDGYEAVVVPRSSTYKNFGIIQTNSCGVIDESYGKYSAEDRWFMPAYALRDTEINVNDRICQFRIQKHQPQIIFEEVPACERTGKARGGHGSSGVQ